jgi:hypothetical protein
MASKGDKRAVVVSAIELLIETTQIQTRHATISPHQLTPYDAYRAFIDQASALVPREAIVQLQPGADPESSVEQILTPSFVCSLAFSRLLRLFATE